MIATNRSIKTNGTNRFFFEQLFENSEKIRSIHLNPKERKLSDIYIYILYKKKRKKLKTHTSLKEKEEEVSNEHLSRQCTIVVDVYPNDDNF